MDGVGPAGAVAAAVGARVAFDWDYAADTGLALAMAGWWATAWRRQEFSWVLWSATAGWLLSWVAGMVTPLWLVAWVALAPLYQAVDQCRRWWQGAAAGAIAGMVASAAALDWVLHGFAHYSGWGSLAAAVFFVPFCVVALWTLAFFSAVLFALKAWRAPLWMGLVPATAFSVVDWIPLKPAHIYWGYSQWPWTTLIQVTDLTGAPGLAFLMGWSGYAVWRAASAWLARERRIPLEWRAVAMPGAVFAAVLLYGVWRGGAIRSLMEREDTRQITVAAVQSNSPERVPNDANELKVELAKQIVRLGAKAAESAHGVDLIVYAESTAPMGFVDGYNPVFRTAYQVVARNSGAYVLVDNIGYSSGTATRPERMWREYLLLNPEGDIAGAYQKKRLVPVGESMPFEAQAPWLREVFSIGTTFEPGSGPATVEMGEVKLAPLVCVEALHEDLSRAATREGADVLISPSNDGWFRSGKQARQHLWGAAFRAVENRRPLIRVANTGHSAAVNAAGDMMGEVSPLRQSWTGAWVVRLVEVRSVFTRWGHWFVVICGFLLSASLAITKRRKVR